MFELGVEHENVPPGVAGQHILAEAAPQDVIPEPAAEFVRPGSALEDVVVDAAGGHFAHHIVDADREGLVESRTGRSVTRTLT